MQGRPPKTCEASEGVQNDLPKTSDTSTLYEVQNVPPTSANTSCQECTAIYPAVQNDPPKTSMKTIMKTKATAPDAASPERRPVPNEELDDIVARFQ